MARANIPASEQQPLGSREDTGVRAAEMDGAAHDFEYVVAPVDATGAEWNVDYGSRPELTDGRIAPAPPAPRNRITELRFAQRAT